MHTLCWGAIHVAQQSPRLRVTSYFPLSSLAHPVTNTIRHNILRAHVLNLPAHESDFPASQHSPRGEYRIVQLMRAISPASQRSPRCGRRYSVYKSERADDLPTPGGERVHCTKQPRSSPVRSGHAVADASPRQHHSRHQTFRNVSGSVAASVSWRFTTTARRQTDQPIAPPNPERRRVNGE